MCSPQCVLPGTTCILQNLHRVSVVAKGAAVATVNRSRTSVVVVVVVRLFSEVCGWFDDDDNDGGGGGGEVRGFE
jgi:hypothetical protein